MGFIFYNPNPDKNLVGDCVIRAVAKITGNDWDKVYTDIVLQGFMMRDMPSSNEVWGEYLRQKGFHRYIVSDNCPECSIKDFSENNPLGDYILATGTHVVALQDGNYFDTWDSGNEIPIYYFKKEN